MNAVPMIWRCAARQNQDMVFWVTTMSEYIQPTSQEYERPSDRGFDGVVNSDHAQVSEPMAEPVPDPPPVRRRWWWSSP